MLHVRRGSQDIDAEVVRADFQSPSVQSARLDGDVLYLRVYDFGDSTEREFDAQLASGLPGAHGVVLDLRDDGGGFVSAATAVISRFVEMSVTAPRRGLATSTPVSSETSMTLLDPVVNRQASGTSMTCRFHWAAKEGSFVLRPS